MSILRDNEVMKILLRYGFGRHTDINYVLRIASQNGHTEVVRLLLEKGANVHGDDGYPIRSASEMGRTEVVRLLLEKGANVHAWDNYPICMASCHGHVEVVKVLLEYEANPYAKDNYAIKGAIEYGHTKVLKLFLSKGYYNSLMDAIITENFFDWIQEFPIPLDFKRTGAMEEVERRYLANENWIKGNRRSNYGFSDITISMF